MASALRVSEFGEEPGGAPLRWVDCPALLTNAQVLELKHALDEQGVVLAELAQEVLGLRMRVEAVERTVDEFDVSVLLHEERLERVELLVDGGDLSGADSLPSPVGAVAPVPDVRFVGNGRVIPSLEEYALLHELGAALGRLYRSAGITQWERAVAVFRVGWELGIPEGERADLGTVWGWLQEGDGGGAPR